MPQVYLLLSLIGVTFGCFSPMIMLSEYSMIAHLITHVCLTGSIISTLFHINHILFQCLFNIACVLAISLTRRAQVQQDAHANLLINGVLSLGLTLVYINSIKHPLKNKAINMTSAALSGFKQATDADFKVLALICITVIIFSVFMGKRFFTYVIQPELSAYYHPVEYKLVWLSFHIVISLVVTIARYIMGPIMCLPILIGPGAIALQWQGKISRVVWLSIAISVMTIYTSIIASHYLPISISSGINFTLLIIYYVAPLYNFIKRQLFVIE